jgi:hypothetical protein
MLPAATTITAVQLPPAFQLIYLPTQVPAFSLFAGFFELIASLKKNREFLK